MLAKKPEERITLQEIKVNICLKKIERENKIVISVPPLVDWARHVPHDGPELQLLLDRGDRCRGGEQCPLNPQA